MDNNNDFKQRMPRSHSSASFARLQEDKWARTYSDMMTESCSALPFIPLKLLMRVDHESNASKKPPKAPKTHKHKPEPAARFRRKNKAGESEAEDTRDEGHESGPDEEYDDNGVDAERRSRSSLDLRGESPTSVSRRRKLWNSFKKAGRRLRSRSRDKGKNKSRWDSSAEGEDLSPPGDMRDEQGDNSDSPGAESPYDDRSPTTNQDFDSLFDEASKRRDELSALQSGRAPKLTKNSSLDRSRSEDKESEVDSGINVLDQSPYSQRRSLRSALNSDYNSADDNATSHSNQQLQRKPRRAFSLKRNKRNKITHLWYQESSQLRQRQKELRAHPFFLLDITLREGRDLVIRDSCGTSDPYVKFKIGNKQHYKSRIIHKNLNPRWDEKLSLPIEDPYQKVRISVFDYDRGLNDDPMGSCEVDPSSLDLNAPTDLKLSLKDESGRKKKESYMGYLTLQATLVPKTQDEKEQYFKKVAGKSDASKKLKTQIWSSVVTCVLVEGKNLIAMDDNGFSDPYVKLRLGNEKYKSKYKAKTLNPRWLEQFDLHMFDEQTSHLEVSVWDHDIGGKDDIMGRTVLDLSTIERETTHIINLELDDGAGIIHFLLTISGTCGSETVSDLASYTPNPNLRQDIVRKYGVAKSLKGIKDIGWLQVKVIKAQGLAAADLGGKSDPFCVLELVNDRLQTHTEYKTLFPEWGKIFTFNVKDIHSVLEVTVYDEDRDKKAEFLGKVAIPLLRIRNGEKRWYTLKDKKVMQRAKGAVLLELDFVFNHVKAAIRTFNPREEKYMQPDAKFKISIMKRNIDRVKKIAESGVEAGKFLQSCFDWESKPRSIAAFAVFLIVTWNFELYMLPVTLLIVFIKELLVVQIVGSLMKDKDEDEYVDEEDDDEEEDKDKEEKKSFKEKLQAIQEVCLQVQEGMDMAASMGERVKNTFNWTVPWLSWLAATLMFVGTIVLFYVPLRYLLIAFGINKFTKKLRAPNAIPNNELLDYLSRVPSDKELIMYRELRPDSNIGTMKKKRS